MNDGPRESRTRSSGARLGAIAVAAALLAALLVPMLVVMLAGPGLDANSTEGHAAGDVAGIASAAVGGAQRLVAGGRDAAPVALPLATNTFVRPADLVESNRAPERGLATSSAFGDAPRAPDEARLF